MSIVGCLGVSCVGTRDRIDDDRDITITLASTLTPDEILSAQEGDSFLDVQTTRITTYMFDGSKWDPKEELKTDKIVLSGSGTPANTLGEIGQFYIDRSTGEFYNKTAKTTWKVTRCAPTKKFVSSVCKPCPEGNSCDGSEKSSSCRGSRFCS